jgi:hypothetical protein
MKRLVISAIALIFTFITLPIAQAQTTVLLTEPTHRQINGQFVDDNLAAQLGVNGRLGQILFSPPNGNLLWLIDPALVDEVTDMSNGYKLTNNQPGVGQLFAQAWLEQLKRDVGYGPVTALVYGNPSAYWVRQLSSHNESYLLTISQTKLQSLLERPVNPPTGFDSASTFPLQKSDIASIKADAVAFDETAAYIDAEKIDTYRLALIKTLNPLLSKSRRDYLLRDLTANAYALTHLVRLTPGKFTITSEHQKLPITLVNDFPQAITVNMKVSPRNARIIVHADQVVSLRPKSKTQVFVSVEVLTSGRSGLTVALTTKSGTGLGDVGVYPLNIRVISPIATWLTTGAAILLFLAASVQSIRRIRKRNK